MGMSPAERQARHRKRMKDRLKELLDEVAELKRRLARASGDPAPRSSMKVPNPTAETGFREIVGRANR